MINIIICDDNKEMLDILKKFMSKIVFKYNIEYKIQAFNSYNEDFLSVMKSQLQNKFYILDIEVKNISGIEIAKKIRNDDWESAIILLTAHYELEYLANHSKILLLDFISKFDLYEEKIKENLDLYISKISKGDKLSFKQGGTKINLNYDDILYIYYDKIARKSIIITKNGQYHLSISLKKVKESLKCNFCYSHRSCIVNKNYVREINKTKKEIVLTNDIRIPFLSKKYLLEGK